LIGLLSISSGCKKGAPSDDETAAASGTESGRELFIEHGCSGCHGETGKGDGSIALPAPAPDLTDPAGYKQGDSLEAISRTIETGIDGSLMLPYPNLTERERIAIAQYLVSVRGN